MPRSIIWMAEPRARAACERLAQQPVIARSAREFIEAPRDATTVSFLDSTTAATLDELALQLGGDDVPRPEARKLTAALSLGPVLLIATNSSSALAAFPAHLRLSHVISPAMLERPSFAAYFAHVIGSATSRATPSLMDWMGTDVSGRRVRIATASRRVDRLAKMADFLASKGTPPQTAQAIRDVAEQLLTNAFYNAPVAAGAVDQPIPRVQDVVLPEDCAIDFAYGRKDDVAFVRVRDPFGSLARGRLLEVLDRQAASGPAQGLRWVLSTASLVAISVVNHQQTEILAAVIDRGSQVPPSARPFACHVFYRDSARRKLWQSANQDTGVHDAGLGNTFVSVFIRADDAGID